MTTTTKNIPAKDPHANGNIRTARDAAGAPSANIQRIENSLTSNPGLFTGKGIEAGSPGFTNLGPKALRDKLLEIKRGYENWADEGSGGAGKVKVGENVRFAKIPGAKAIAVIADVPKAAQADDKSPQYRLTVISSEKNSKGQYVELLKADPRVGDNYVQLTNRAAFYDEHRQPKS
jgi:hypothetical protein